MEISLTLILLIAVAIVAGIMAMNFLKGIQRALFGDAALRKLEGVVPPATSGMLPVMAVAERKGRGRKNSATGRFSGIAVDGDEWGEHMAYLRRNTPAYDGYLDNVWNRNMD